MGDRGNVYVHEGDRPGVYLYTHWEGTQLPVTVKAALDRGRERWTDAPYLARVIFAEMVRWDDPDSLTGFGIDVRECDVGRLVDVDTSAQVVRVDGGPPRSFEDFVGQDFNFG